MKIEKFKRESQWCYRSHGITVVSDRELPTEDDMHQDPVDVYNLHIEYVRSTDISDFAHECGIEGTLAPQELVNLKVEHHTVEELITSAAKCLDIPIT